jgi:dihydrofolate reductase
MLTVTLIAAVSEDGYISRGTGVPWHLPADIAHFRAATAGKWLLVGRKTYEEMLGWFTDHMPLVLSRDTTFQPRHGRRISSVAEGIALADAANQGEIMVCGGGSVYAEAMPVATKLLITRVDAPLGDGIPFPVIDPSTWRITTEWHHPADAEHAHALTITTFERR